MEDLLSRAREAYRDEVRAWSLLRAWTGQAPGRTILVLSDRIVAMDDHAVNGMVLSTKADCPVDLAIALRLPGFAGKG